MFIKYRRKLPEAHIVKTIFLEIKTNYLHIVMSVKMLNNNKMESKT